ncbi:MAG: SOS response-associated peptidase [Chloroflexota bacterium]|nr:SOS response-associated peptidase [Chloroflexota bacterium]MDE2941456.1 SOS response-associated peptidase [Chloroflexota bacterium]MDE3268543.1 SOS response-associated peptidase [Chloroflexota bacterium]
MCGRYSLAVYASELALRFDFEGGEETLPPRFNIAPTQEVLAVTRNADDSRNAARGMRWGLIPFWAKDISIGNRMINARAESIDTSPAFHRAFERRRCLVIADGFYEWLKVGKDRVPMRISLRSGEPFAFAGLWETWRSPDGEPVASCSIITTTANAVMEPIHSRMPVILPEYAESVWLDAAGARSAAELKELLIPYAGTDLEVYEVSKLVNSPRNDTPEVMARVG